MLNPELYHALETLFPEGVQIAKEDEPLVLGNRVDAQGKTRRWKESGGEEYRVCCPMCGDTRFRLSINHAWGTDRLLKYPAMKLVKCFNEECQLNEVVGEKYQRNPVHYLLQEMRRYFRMASQGLVHIKRPKTEKERQIKEVLPFPKDEWTIDPKDVPTDCTEALYLAQDRRFDLAQLVQHWGVRFAREYPVVREGKDYGWLAGRLFIPCPGRGWQARLLREPRSEFERSTKYFTATGYRKAAYVYGLDNAVSFKFGVLVEGVTDVWRVGGPGICPFGKSISDEQAAQIGQHLDLVAICLDPDVVGDRLDTVARTRIKLGGYKVKTFMVQVDDAKDPADRTFEELWDRIEHSAQHAGYGQQIRRPADDQRIRVDR